MGDHLVEVADGFDTVVRLLEQTLAHGGHDTFVLTYALGDTDEGTKFWRQIDVLALLFDFKERLIKVHDLNVVLLLEVQNHGNGFTDLALLELTSLRSHIPLDGGYFVGLVLSIACHDDGAFELFINCLTNLFLVRWLSHKALAFFFESLDLLLYELEAVVNRKVLGDVVNN